MPNEFGKPRWGGGGLIRIVGAVARITQASPQYRIDKTFSLGSPEQDCGVYRPGSDGVIRFIQMIELIQSTDHQ